jgi:hypothetical protein
VVVGRRVRKLVIDITRSQSEIVRQPLPADDLRELPGDEMRMGGEKRKAALNTQQTARRP